MNLYKEKSLPLVGLAADFVKSLQISDTFGSLLYKWNPLNCRLELKSIKKFRIYNFRVGFQIIYLLLVLVQISWTWKDANRMVRMHSTLFATDFVLNITSLYLTSTKAKEIVALLNGFMSFQEKHHVNSTETDFKKTKGYKITKLLLFACGATGISMPILYHLEILRNPCFPMYLGYWLSDQCGTKLGSYTQTKRTLAELLIKLSISAFSFVNWSIGFASYCFQIGVAFVLEGHCLRYFISKYGTNIMNCSKISRIQRKKILSFREIQLLCIHHRAIYSKYFVGASTICIISLAILCLNNSIVAAFDPGAGKQQLGFDLLYLWGTFGTGLVLVTMTGILSDVYKVSKYTRRQMSTNLVLKRNIWFKRFLKSCPIIRIYIAGNNFVDELTPLTFENFVIMETVDILLLK
ncbi:unnamed protein product [Orchesella dallaii]|uniref:Gustatory receptor n=1 Tax=Orchesella dallaii TaxID=48710 RepID=A0ABP1R823_9HEXA